VTEQPQQLRQETANESLDFQALLTSEFVGHFDDNDPLLSLQNLLTSDLNTTTEREEDSKPKSFQDHLWQTFRKSFDARIGRHAELKDLLDATSSPSEKLRTETTLWQNDQVFRREVLASCTDALSEAVEIAEHGDDGDFSEEHIENRYGWMAEELAAQNDPDQLTLDFFGELIDKVATMEDQPQRIRKYIEDQFTTVCFSKLEALVYENNSNPLDRFIFKRNVSKLREVQGITSVLAYVDLVIEKVQADKKDDSEDPLVRLVSKVTHADVIDKSRQAFEEVLSYSKRDTDLKAA